MKILFDLNVLLDVAYRPQRHLHPVQLYHRLVATRQHQDTFPACGYTTLYYQLLSMPDFEDACVTITALEGQCAMIVTRNLPDFQASPIPALTPTALLAQL